MLGSLVTNPIFYVLKVGIFIEENALGRKHLFSD